MSIHYLALKRTTSLWESEATLVISVWQGKTWLHFTLFHPQDTMICQACNPQVLPPVGTFVPPPPPVRRKKWQKLAISSRCLDFCPLRNAFLTENHRFSNLNVMNIPKINRSTGPSHYKACWSSWKFTGRDRRTGRVDRQ